MALNIVLFLRVTQLVFAIIILGLTAYVAHWYNSRTTAVSPSQINFLIFNALWTLLAVIYLTVTPPYFPRLAHKYAIAALDALTMLFWFAGFIALAVFLTGLTLCVGHVCRAAQAAAVFAAFEWYVVLLRATFVVLEMSPPWRSRGIKNQFLLPRVLS
ncbi:hypothetical protein MMC06_003327 [Schaereria dolodes]|nr:hypothetical protein [Schaereria dolodes]